MSKILLVEDDKGLGYVLKEYMELYDYEVSWAINGQLGWEMFNKSTFDLCILDVMLPQLDGYDLAKKIRVIDERIPLIFLTAKGLKVDKLKGFKAGADDYMVKPVDEEELLMRIEAILKRVRYAEKNQHSYNKQFELGRFKFDPVNQALYLEEKRMNLTQKEASILLLLCQNMGRILDRKKTLKQIWGESDYFKRRSMDVFVSRLRTYLKEDPRIKITNIHGKGYILTVELT